MTVSPKIHFITFNYFCIPTFQKLRKVPKLSQIYKICPYNFKQNYKNGPNGFKLPKIHPKVLKVQISPF